MQKLLTLLVVLVLAGCKQAPELPAVISPYKIDIQQGNLVTQEMVAKLKAGMTRAQVRFALGSPLVIDPFRTDRWDYVYLYQSQGKETQRRRLTVIFEDDKLLRMEGDVVPVDATQEPAKPAAKPPVAAKPAEKPPVAATPAAKPGVTAADKPAAKPPVAAKPAEKPPVAATPVAKPVAAAPDQPAAPKPEAAKPDAAKPDAAAGTAAAGAAQPDAAKADGTQAAAKPAAASTEAAKTDAAKADEKKEKPKEKGFFGRMMDKIGF